jgi:DNA polymerase III alpha subunit
MRIPLFKTTNSIGKSIIQYGADKEPDLNGAPYLEYLCKKNNITDCFIVEDSISSIIGIYQALSKFNINMNFGLQLNFVNDVSLDNSSLHKNIIFATGDSYKSLIKLSTLAHVKHSHKNVPRIDYNILHDNMHEDFILAIPFYDSFLANNLLTFQNCVVDYRGIRPIVFLEENGLPFDYLIRDAAINFAKDTNLDIWETKTVLYENKSDFLAWQTRKLMERKSFGTGNTLSKPNLDHCGSNEFCIEAITNN